MTVINSIWSRICDTPEKPAFGIGRSLVALGLLVTIAFDGTNVLFAPDPTRFPVGRCGNESILDFSLFCLFGFDLGHRIAILVFLLVILGYFPAITAIPFAYSAWSLQASIAIPEGGDQLASNLALILLPISLLDWRLNQWSPPETNLLRRTSWKRFFSSMRGVAVMVLSGQISIVYFFAAVEKFAVEEWKDGTALYYWSTDPNFGATGIRGQLLELLSTNSLFVVLLTWGTLALEMLLAFAWMSTREIKIALLAAGITFHIGIGIFMGLISFSLIMCGALFMYLGNSLRSTCRNRKNFNPSVVRYKQ